jgi:zinc ribbon protein
MTGFCSRCGAALLGPARFCGNCGARLGDNASTPVLSAHDLRDSTEEVPAVAAPAEEALTENTRAAPRGDSNADPVSTSPGIAAITGAAAQGLRRALDDAREWLRPRAERWWAEQRGHSTRNSVAACGLLLLLAITLAWSAGGTDGGSPDATKTTRSTRPVATARTPKRARSNLERGAVGPDPRVYTYATQLEQILQQSAAGRTQLASTVRSVQPSCGSPSPQAQQQLTNVVENRSGLVHQLDLLGPGPDPATQAVSSLLHQALESSTQADVEYRNWNAAMARNPSDQCSADPSVAGSLAAAHAYDSNATTFKTQFVVLFDPLAAQLGLPMWSPSDF